VKSALDAAQRDGNSILRTRAVHLAREIRNRENAKICRSRTLGCATDTRHPSLTVELLTSLRVTVTSHAADGSPVRQVHEGADLASLERAHPELRREIATLHTEAPPPVARLTLADLAAMMRRYSVLEELPQHVGKALGLSTNGAGKYRVHAALEEADKTDRRYVYATESGTDVLFMVRNDREAVFFRTDLTGHYLSCIRVRIGAAGSTIEHLETDLLTHTALKREVEYWCAQIASVEGT
jgi:hypothetical protein